jgi:hypothetical protein
MGTVDAHAFGHSLLAEPRGKAAATQVSAKHPADVHPQEGGEPRILLLRIKIRGYAADASRLSRHDQAGGSVAIAGTFTIIAAYPR